MQKFTTRFAPSPTGYLHIGGLRTALYNYLYARKNRGQFLLRIEDTDSKRNSEEATKAILEAFKWCGLDFDQQVVYQSRRFELYKKHIDLLLEKKLAYRCYMSKEELDSLRKKQEAAKQRPRYDGRYRDFTGTPPSDIAPVIRIKAPQQGEISFIDGVKGEVKFEANDIMDDFIIARSDGSPTYNFCVVVDDALMGVSAVIRGDDHLSNTPKQIVLYEALGFKVPTFYHLAMIHGEDGKKLSKRHGATDVMEYKNMGFTPQALLNFLVRLGWSHGDDEIFSLNELKDLFDPTHISKSASAYSFKKLEWLNQHYIKSLPFKELKKQCKELGFDFDTVGQRAEFLCDLLRERSKTLLDLINGAKKLIQSPQNYDEKAVSKFINKENLGYLREFLELLNEKNSLNLASNRQNSLNSAKYFEDLISEFLAKKNLELKHIAQALRVALTGVGVSPGIYEVLEFIGIKEAKERIEKLLNTYERAI